MLNYIISLYGRLINSNDLLSYADDYTRKIQNLIDARYEDSGAASYEPAIVKGIVDAFAKPPKHLLQSNNFSINSNGIFIHAPLIELYLITTV